MYRTIKSIGGAGLLLALVVLPAAGQQNLERHRGFWFGFGLGGGWDSFDWSFGNRGRGGAGYLRMGGTVNQHVLVGGEALAWFREGNNDTEVERTNVSLMTLVYPGSEGGLFFKGGFGVASNQIRQGVDREGVGLTLGSGFDFRLARNFYVTPNVDVLTQFLSDETNTSLLFTVGLGWH